MTSKRTQTDRISDGNSIKSVDPEDSFVVELSPTASPTIRSKHPAHQINYEVDTAQLKLDSSIETCDFDPVLREVSPVSAVDPAMLTSRSASSSSFSQLMISSTSISQCMAVDPSILDNYEPEVNQFARRSADSEDLITHVQFLPVSPCRAVCPAGLQTNSEIEHDEESDTLSSDEMETRPLVIRAEKPAVAAVRPAASPTAEADSEYFKAVRKAHYTKDLGHLRYLNKKYKDSVAEVNQSGEQSWRPLQLAAAFGNSDLVRLLCEHEKIDIGAKDKDGDTALHAASYWDHDEAIGLILYKAKNSTDEWRRVINERNNANETPISYAASRYHKESCIEMIACVPPLCYTFNIVHPGRNPGRQDVEKDHGIFAKLRTPEAVAKFKEMNQHVILYHQQDSQGKSLINIMITKMPEMALHILDKSIMTTKIAILGDEKYKNEHKDIHRVIVDFGALENYYGEESSVSDYPEEETGGTLISGYYRHGSNPLQIMTKMSHRLEFLTHPVVEALIITKWEKFARTYFYIFTFLLYLFFFSMLMAYQVSQIKPFIPLENGTIVRTWIDNSSHTCDKFPDGCFKEKPHECVVLGYVLLAMSSIRLFLELLDLFDQIFNEPDPESPKSNVGNSILGAVSTWLRGLGNYLMDPENYLQIILYGSSLVFSLNVLDQQTVMSPFHWQIGTLSVLTGFINLLLLLQVFPKIGIYIIMFFKIAWTFVTKILALLVFFIIAFVVIFHMLLSHTDIFRNALSGESIFKTLSAGVSGVEYDDYADVSLTYPTSTLVGLTAFALFVQVLFLNLATALAIEDVKEIRSGAEKAMNALRIKHIYNAERIVNTLQWAVNHICFQNDSNFMKYQSRFRNMPVKKFKFNTMKDIQACTKVGDSCSNLWNPPE